MHFSRKICDMQFSNGTRYLGHLPIGKNGHWNDRFYLTVKKAGLCVCAPYVVERMLSYTMIKNWNGPECVQLDTNKNVHCKKICNYVTLETFIYMLGQNRTILGCPWQFKG